MQLPRVGMGLCSLWFRRGACLALCGLPAVSAPAQPAQRVEITATRASDSVAPITVLRSADLARAGVTNAREALSFIAANQAADGAAAAVGEPTGGIAEADLRGLGPERGLVLLNGRRLANQALEGGTIDLNAIPLAAIDRIEVRRDGASALHGSGGISGVIDFILRDDFQGIELNAEVQTPQRSGGGRVTQAAAVLGVGALANERYNLLAVVEMRRQSALAARDRRYARSALRPGLDADILADRLGDATLPGTLDGFNPSRATGCAPPRSLALPDDDERCGWDSAADADLLPAQDHAAALARVKFALPSGSLLTAELLFSQGRTRGRQSPSPLQGVLPQTSPFWIDEVEAEEVEGYGPAAIAVWRAAEAGLRQSQSRASARRALLGWSGSAGAWRWDLGAWQSVQRVDESVRGGHLDRTAVQTSLAAGRINPFGTQTADGLAALRAAEVRGPVAAARAEVRAADLLLTWTPQARLELGAQLEARRESLDFRLRPAALQVADLGFDFARDVRGERSGQALQLRADATPHPALRIEAAWRADRSSDASTQSSPLLALRWQALPTLALRATAGHSFRAPTLYETHEPQRLRIEDEREDDPLHCPDGEAQPGLDPDRVCEQAFLRRTGGPVAAGLPARSLKPETARHAMIGLQFNAPGGLSVSIDAWQIRLRRSIDALSVEQVLDNAAFHSARIVRCSALGTAAANRPECQDAEDFDPIAFIDTPVANLGRIHTRGIDLGLGWTSAVSAWGRFDLQFNASYIGSQRHRLDGETRWHERAGRYVDDQGLPRWQHAWQLGWQQGRWSAALAQRWIGRYGDAEGPRRVAAHRLLDVSAGLTLTAATRVELGIKNLLDRDPPWSNQTERPQANYEPRLADPVGRAWTLRVSHRFD